MLENELREKFEKVCYDRKWNIFRYPHSEYHNKMGEYVDDFVNGAWFAYQEQQKVINNLMDELTIYKSSYTSLS